MLRKSLSIASSRANPSRLRYLASRLRLEIVLSAQVLIICSCGRARADPVTVVWKMCTAYFRIVVGAAERACLLGSRLTAGRHEYLAPGPRMEILALRSLLERDEAVSAVWIRIAEVDLVPKKKFILKLIADNKYIHRHCASKFHQFVNWNNTH
jgi:hypothetical protein